MYRIVAAGLIALMIGAPALADDDIPLPAVTHAATAAKCGACHMTFPADLLPPASWQMMMRSLDNHFGVNAAVGEPVRSEIEAYLVAHADNRRGVSGAPQRVSRLAWFVNVHGSEVSRRAIRKARSWANCTACHSVGVQNVSTDGGNGDSN